MHPTGTHSCFVIVFSDFQSSLFIKYTGFLGFSWSFRFKIATIGAMTHKIRAAPPTPQIIDPLGEVALILLSIWLKKFSIALVYLGCDWWLPLEAIFTPLIEAHKEISDYHSSLLAKNPEKHTRRNERLWVGNYFLVFSSFIRLPNYHYRVHV